MGGKPGGETGMSCRSSTPCRRQHTTRRGPAGRKQQLEHIKQRLEHTLTSASHGSPGLSCRQRRATWEVTSCTSCGQELHGRGEAHGAAGQSTARWLCGAQQLCCGAVAHVIERSPELHLHLPNMAALSRPDNKLSHRPRTCYRAGPRRPPAVGGVAPPRRGLQGSARARAWPVRQM